MNKTFIIVLLTVFLTIGLLNTEIMASNLEQNNRRAIGISTMADGGITYRHFLDSDRAIDITGKIFGESNDHLAYNIGVAYNRFVDEKSNISLSFVPGFSWRQIIDFNEDYVYEWYDGTYRNRKMDLQKMSLSFSFAVESEVFRLENIHWTIYNGMEVSFIRDYDNNKSHNTEEEALNQNKRERINIKQTLGFSILYYF